MGAQGAAWLASVSAFALAMAATPGPNNAMVAASGASFGFRRTLPHILGIGIGFAVMVGVVALGAGGPLRAFPWLQDVLHWVGAAYMLWLAWRIATIRPGAEETGARGGRPLTFLQAALFQWVNPKAWVIAAGAVVTYTTAGAGMEAQAAALAAVFLAVTLPSVALWTWIGVGAARLLRRPSALRAFNLAMAALLVASLLVRPE